MKEYKVIDFEDQNAEIIENNGECLLITNIKINDEYFVSSFKNIKTGFHEGKTLLKAKTEILYAIAIFLNKNNFSIEEALINLDEELKRSKINYLKFRGDLAELIFLYKWGGEIINNLTGDIVFEDKVYEIKSFSNQLKYVILSLQQLKEETEKIAIGLSINNDGYSMSNLIEKVSNNQEFVSNLISKYSNSILFKIKYSVDEIKNITNSLPKIEFPNNVISGKLKIKI